VRGKPAHGAAALGRVQQAGVDGEILLPGLRVAAPDLVGPDRAEPALVLSPELAEDLVSGFGGECAVFLLGLAVVAVVSRLLPEGLAGSRRRLVSFGVFIAITALAGLLVYGRLFGDRSVPLWAAVLLLMLTLDVLVISRAPYELAPYRLLLIGVALMWIVALVCAGSLRSTLLRLQLENLGIAAEYRDIQIASGILVAWAGGLLAFAGVVALWARRRDELEERSRAGQQLAGAELSATELEEAV
jgi:hypothetical protein